MLTLNYQWIILVWLFFVNTIGLPFNSGTIIYFLIIIGAIAYGLSYTKKHNTTINKRHFEPVVQGLFDVYNNGTASFLQVPGIEICGKTGTAENYGIIYGKREKLKDHSWFVCFAPRENPTIAVAVIVENAGFGATWVVSQAGVLSQHPAE